MVFDAGRAPWRPSLHHFGQPGGAKPTYAHIISTVHRPLEHGGLEILKQSVEEKDGNQYTEQNMCADVCTGFLSLHTTRQRFIDRVNARIISALPSFRWTRWKSKFLIFLLTAMCSNAHRLGQLYYGSFIPALTTLMGPPS